MAPSRRTLESGNTLILYSGRCDRRPPEEDGDKWQVTSSSEVSLRDSICLLSTLTLRVTTAASTDSASPGMARGTYLVSSLGTERLGRRTSFGDISSGGVHADVPLVCTGNCYVIVFSLFESTKGQLTLCGSRNTMRRRTPIPGP